MIDTGFATRIRKLSDDELERKVSAAFNSAYCESFGGDHEARADALQEYRMLEVERKRRKESK